MPATYEPIATTTLGSAAATITFSSIPATYTDLRLVFIGTSNPAFEQAAIRFNSDTGSNYSWTFLFGTGSSASSGRSSNQTYIPLTAQFTLDGTQPSFRTADIFSYAGSTNKTVLVEENSDYNGSGAVARDVCLWRNTSAINSITITTLTTNTFKAGTTATLYGILKA